MVHVDLHEFQRMISNIINNALFHAKRFLANLGGELIIESTVNKGATVRVEIEAFFKIEKF